MVEFAKWKQVVGKWITPFLCSFCIVLSVCPLVSAEETVYSIDIPSQEVIASLQSLASQTDLSLIFSPKDVGASVAPAISGKYTIDAALGILLEETDLEYEKTSATTISIKKKDPKPTNIKNNSEGSKQSSTQPSPRLTSKSKRVANAAETASEDVFMLEEITVTSLKRSTNVQRTAVSTTAISGEHIRAEGTYRLDELLMDVPGLQVQHDTQGSKFVIRGVSENLHSSADFPTATYIDGIYLAHPAESRTGFYDIDRVEVLRGPQGTLFGMNSLGGTVNIISKNPDLDGYSGSGTLEYGNYSLLHTEGMLNAPISDTLAVRTAFYTESREGYLSHGQDDSDVKSARFKLLYRPNERIQAVLTADTTRIGGLGPDYVDKLAALRSIDLEDLDDPWNNASASSDNVNYTKSDRFNLNSNVYLDFATLNYQFSSSDLESKLDHNLFGRHIIDTRTLPMTSHQLLLNSPEESKLKWTAGLFYLEKDAPVRMDIVGLLVNDTPYDKTTSKAAFFHGTYSIQDRLRLTLGGRYSKMKKKSASGLIEGPPIFPLGLYKNSTEDDPLTYKVGIEADLGEAGLLYITVSTGYRSGGLLPLSSGGLLAYGSQELTAYQLGSKNRFFDNRLQINGELFYYDYETYQLSYNEYVEGLDGIVQAKISDASDVYNYGGEVEVSYLMTMSDRIDASVSYLKSDIGTLPGELAPYSHNTSNYSPEWSGTLAYQHDFMLSNGGEIVFRGEMNFESSYWCTYEHIVGSQQPSYYTSNARLNYESPDDQFILGCYVHNIGDYPVMTNYQSGSTSSDSDYYRVQAPRTIGAMITIRF